MIQTTDSSGAEKQGTPITGATMPSGGKGSVGWLSAIWKAITDRLPSALVSGRLDVNVGNTPSVQGSRANAGTDTTSGKTHISVGGSDGTNLRILSTDASGRPNVNINGAVDTELPAAVAMSDAMTPANAPIVGNYNLLYRADNDTWLREPAPTHVTVLTSAARSATTNSSSYFNTGHRGIIVYLTTTVAPGGGITLHIQGRDSIGGSWVTINSPTNTITTGVGTFAWELSPGGSSVGTSFNVDRVAERIGGMLPYEWRIRIVHGGANLYTYYVAAVLLR